MIYFIKGGLPWQGVKAKTRTEKYEIIKEMKLKTPIEELVNAHPSIRRLVFVTGSGSAAIFQQHFEAWLASGRFVCGNERAFKVFGDGSKRGGKGTTRVPMKGNAGDGAANGD